MAGYLFAFSDEESLFEAMGKGSYSTRMSTTWTAATEGTLGDFVTMQPGDSAYFFSKRKVYGIGSIIEVVPGTVVLENYEGATSKKGMPSGETILPEPPQENKTNRWVVCFEPDPFMFRRGIDMDDLLSSDPDAFKSLRVFWKRSFIKLDDTEERAFRAALLRRNLDVLRNPTESGVIGAEHILEHARVAGIVADRNPSPRVRELVASSRKGSGSLSSEMMVEVALLSQLSQREASAIEVFGEWDYLSHQVHASPAKAIDYMDKIDVFGYRHIAGYEPIVEKYLVAELKKDTASGEDLQQVMKYVDWARSEYANGDYSLVQAFLVAHEFDMESIGIQLDTTDRHYLAGYRPPVPVKWQDLTLVRYDAGEDGLLRFETVCP